MDFQPKQRERTPLSIGWDAARANFVPALLLQAAMAALLVAYYISPRCAAVLNRLAQYKQAHEFTFVIVAAVAAGALLPELLVIIFFQQRKLRRENLRSLAFTIPIWAIDGVLVDLLYRANAWWFGTAVTLPVLAAKIAVDQFGYNPLFAAPTEVLVYEWKNDGIKWASVRRMFTWAHYRDKIVPTLLATWVVWIPLVAIIYSLPLPLQYPLFSLALTFWVLLLIYMTNRFSGKIEGAPTGLPAVASHHA